MPNTLILVHGFMDTASRMAYLAGQLRNRGWRVLTPSLKPSNGSSSIEQLADQLQLFVLENTSKNERIDLVGFSMGGLICRYYVQFLGGLSKTDRLVTISTPHQGTVSAYLLRTVAIKQMRPGSAFLQRLNADLAPLGQLIFASFYTPLDIIILPAKSSIVHGARNYKVYTVMHRLMVYDSVVISKLVEILHLNFGEKDSF